MFSVIIPTMWKSKNLIPFIYDLINCKMVGEVIIIDNDSNATPEDMILSCHYKVKVMTQDKNIFVNPAWNLGVSCALYDKICILSDNSIFDIRLFNRVYSYISCNVGVIGINWNHEVFNDGMIRIKPFMAGDMANNFFRCFFIHKDSWFPIPKKLQLYFGDNYIWDNCIWDERSIFVVNDLFFYTESGGTTGKIPEAVEMFYNEKIIYRDIILSKGHEPSSWCPTHFKE